MINTLKIGTVHYGVSQVENLYTIDADKMRFLNGHIEYHKCRIRIDDALPDQLKPVAVLHEAIHGIIEQAGISDEDEGLVRALGYGIAELIRDNPHFIDWLNRAALPQTGSA